MNTIIINKLKELKPILNKKYEIEEFAVFGSMQRVLTQKIAILILRNLN